VDKPAVPVGRVLRGFQYVVRFEGTTAACMWDVAPSSLVEFYRRFGVHCCLHHQDDDFYVYITIIN
jgi:hypothetical protein